MLVLCHLLQMFASYGQHTTRTTTGIINGESPTRDKQLFFLPRHGQCHQEFNNLTWRIELTSLRVRRLLRTTDNNLEDCSHHGITHPVWM